jgi:hypothetical protein
MDTNHIGFNFGLSIHKATSFFQKVLPSITSTLEPNGRIVMSFDDVILKYGLLKSECNTHGKHLATYSKHNGWTNSSL